MQRILLEILACPAYKGPLQLTAEVENAGAVEIGFLRCERCHQQYPLIRHVPRFVPAENYADNFGFQWTSSAKLSSIALRSCPCQGSVFFVSSGWTPEELAGKTVLEVGCGAGRFAEVALQCGAKLVALHYLPRLTHGETPFAYQPGNRENFSSKSQAEVSGSGSKP